MSHSTAQAEQASKAAAFRRMAEDHFIDDQGIMRCNLRRDTLKPFTDAELEPFEITLTGDSKAGRWTYEDTFFISGLYLWSLVEEYQCTGEEQCRDQAKVFFDSLYALAQKSFTIDDGFIGKPWGGEPGRETTLDQTFYLCVGLHAFAAVADDERRQRAQHIIVENTRWWIRRDYRNFQTPSDALPVWLGASHVGAMLAQVLLAYVHSGDDAFFVESKRLKQEYQADAFPTRQSVQWTPVDENGLKVRRIALWHHALAVALRLLQEMCPERSAYWQERIAAHWHDELKLGLRPDGMAYQCVRVNLADESEVPIRPDEAGFVGAATAFIKNHNAQGWRWVSALQSSCAACHIALSAVLAADAAPCMREQTAAAARTVIDKLTPADVTRAFDPDGRQCYESRRHWLESLSSKGLAAWLVAYWRGKRIGLLS